MNFTVEEALRLNAAGECDTALAMLHVFVGDPSIAPRGHASLWSAMGTIYESLGQGAEAHFAYRHAVSLDPHDVSALNNLGTAALGWNRWPEATRYLRSALSLDPNHACALNGMGTVHIQRGEYDTALAYYDRALAVEPDNAYHHWNRSMALLGTGQWVEGWREHEWRRKLKRVHPRTAPVSNKPHWEGESLVGKRLLIHCEQGWGDMLMWARVGQMLEALGATLIWEAHEPLEPLFRLQPWIHQTFMAGTKTLPDHDLHLWLGSAPRVMGITPDTEASFPYLATHKASRIGTGKPVVGLVWRGRVTHGTNELRSAPHDFAQKVVNECRNVTWLSFQKDHGPPKGAVDGRSYLTDFAQSAAVLKQCDLLVSIDSAPVHLAGALNVPCVMLLHHNAEWRWRPDLSLGRSRWYRSVEFMQQTSAGDWDSLIPQLAARLN